ncbi:uncharacterized protein KIAA1211-like [Salarias fasciatus]|uniref:uncharacterized protein KIAA1211-like n=1 Tax=Salarias fasciatus TaxID=181472 RepID=UPI0011764C6C|nr:uncharacterized protein KIAA1211-like homolog [Salarias fasciatus]
MEVFSGDNDENTDDIPGRRKWKLTSLKTRLLGKSQISGDGAGAKLSHSESDITAAEGLGSDEDLASSQGMIGSRTLSHDSIFLSDPVETDAQPARVLSQENVHSKIKALQLKLQQQKMHLGPPPLVLPIRRPEGGEAQAEDRKPHSPPGEPGADVPPQGGLLKDSFQMMPQPGPGPLSPSVKPLSPAPSHPVPLPVFSNPPSSSSSSSVEPPLDFSSPAHFTACLDSSAARHRMLVKPRNQRASSKKKPAVVQASSEPETRNSTDVFESVKEGEQQPDARDEETAEGHQGRADPSTSQDLPSKPEEAAPASKPAHFPQQDDVLPSVASQLLRAKPHRPVDVRPGERPHSSCLEAAADGKRDSEVQEFPREKPNAVSKPGLAEASSHPPPAPLGSSSGSRSSALRQAPAEDERTRGISRPALGSGSFHFSITTARSRDGERPRSGSFVGVMEQVESWQRTTREHEEKATREKEEPRGLQPRGGLFTAGRVKPDGAPPKIPATALDKRDSLKRVAAKNIDTAEEAEATTSQEVVEVAEEAREVQEVQEEEGKTAFGVKLRSTSQSIRQRADSCSRNQSKTTLPDDQCDAQKRQDTSQSVPGKLQTNRSSSASSSRDHRPTDPDPPGRSAAVEDTPKEPEPQPAPQASSSEVSWMSMAMEKTRSLQQLFTSRFPMQTAGRPQAAPPASSLTEAVAVTQSANTQQHPASQPAADPQSRVSIREDREAAVQRDSPSLTARRVVWTGSASDRAALLERRAEWRSAPGPNGVELRKAQTEVQTSAELPVVAKIPPSSRDTVPEGRPGVTLRDSSPTKIPENLREDKWPRKSVAQTSSPSSSPTMPSVLQSMSDSGQPSWMELAKRKSMAWSDKTMD